MNCVQDMVISSEFKNISSYTRLIKWLNFQETFLVDKLSNSANPESRHCVVRTVALMEKRKEKKRKKKMNKLRSIYIVMQEREREREKVFVGSFKSRASIWCSFCPFLADYLPYHFYRQ